MSAVEAVKTHDASPPKAVYIHIPFCRHKCHYCDFNTYALKGQPVDAYLEALGREMEQTVALHPPDQIETIFVGGGTPTVLNPEQMSKFLSMIQQYFSSHSPFIEFTMEANPGTTDLDKLQVMKEGGVNRISLGVQTFDNGLLKAIGRIHQQEEIYRSIELAKQVGFDNISIDLMFGLPNQTLQQLKQSLTAALQLDLQHYSIYSLIIEENTPFHTLYMKNELPLPDEDEEWLMFEHIIKRLTGAGYNHYEISNFAKPGFEGQHNTIYWRNGQYYGIGAGAHGYINQVRHVNIKEVQPYIEATFVGLPLLSQSVVSRKEAMEDFMMVGFRLLKGVRSEDFKKQFGCTMEQIYAIQLQQLLDRQLIERTEEGYRLSKKGILFGNEVFAAFLS